MPQLHINDYINKKLIDLDDEICLFKRTTGREYVLILVPCSPDENIQASFNGEPVDLKDDADITNLLNTSIAKRHK